MLRFGANGRLGLQRAAAAALALVGALLALLALALGGAFTSILEEAERARGELAPAISQQSQQAVLAAQLSRQAEVVINARTRATRTRAMLEAEGLAAHFAAAASVELQARLNAAMHAMRRSGYRADLTDALAAALERAEATSQRALLQAAETSGENGGFQEMKTALALHRLLTEAMRADERRVDALEVEFRSLAGAATLGATPVAHSAPEMTGAFEARREMLRVAAESARDAEKAHEQLRALSQGLQADAETQTRGMADAVYRHADNGLRLAAVGAAVTVAALALIAWAVRRHVVTPIRAAAAALETARRRRRRVALPAAALREVDDLSRAVESFGGVLGDLQELAHVDPLTGLANRRLLLEHLRHAVAKNERGGRLGALMFIDLDGFKQVNDRLGHRCGDDLLAEAARRLTAVIRAGDLAARVGGDEFCIVMEDIARPQDAEILADRVVDALSLPLLDGRATVGASIGVAYFPTDAVGVEGLLHRADEAMYAAKRNGKGCWSVWSAATAA